MPEVVPLHQGELALDAAVAERCEQHLALARTHMAAGFYHWLEAGKQFAAIKAEVGSRCWGPWLREHEIPRRSADRLVQISERFDPILITMSKIEDFQIDFGALHALASRSVPVAAAQEAVSRAAAGEHITREQAEELIAQGPGTAGGERRRARRDVYGAAGAGECSHRRSRQ
jgi:hypothetical protein